MSKKTKTIAPASQEAIVQAALALVQKLVAVERDPDLVSVFSIARAHGYVITSKFWHQESNTLAAALQAYAEGKQTAAAAPAPEAQAV